MNPINASLFALQSMLFGAWLAAIVVCAIYVLIRSVCTLNIFSRATPMFLYVWYAADAMASAFVLAGMTFDNRPPTTAEGVIMVGLAAGFFSDRRRMSARIHRETT